MTTALRITADARRFAGILILLIVLTPSAHACWATWTMDTHPNTFATQADLDNCVAQNAGWNDAGTYHIKDLHRNTGYDAVYVPALSARGQEILGTISRTAIRSYYVLIDIERPPVTQVQYRDRTVTVPVERIVERTVEPPPLAPLRAEPSTEKLWNGNQPYALISDTVMTTLRSTGSVMSRGAGEDELLDLPCPTDPEATRRVAWYGRAASQFSGAATAVAPYWVLLSVTAPPTIEVRDREVPVSVDRFVEEPNPMRIFIERNMTKTVLLTVLFLAFVAIVLPYAHYKLQLRKTMLDRMFRH